MPLTKITTEQDLNALAATAPSAAVVAYFWASWAPMCTQTEQLAQKLSQDCSNLLFASVEAEEAEELSNKFDIQSVPAFVFIKNGARIGGIVGANAPDITKQVMALNASSSSPSKPTTVHHAAPANLPIPTASAKPSSEDLNDRLAKLVKQSPVMVFMKGSPGAEKCGFSRKCVEILQSEGIKFGSFDILEDEAVRQGLKEFSKWPTYPQIYAKGTLVGGLDIIKELQEAGELKSELNVAEEPLDVRLAKLVKQSPVMVFMKGSPGAEKCGFSRQLVELLNQHKIQFGHFDILEDEEVRQGLKDFSKWPTYPQVYNKGNLVGGLDICKELAQGGELVQELS